MNFHFHDKTFRVVRNEGPSAEVTTDTTFHFTQRAEGGLEIVEAQYSGGGVLWGRMLGVLEEDKMRHAYVQVNYKGEFSSGQSIDEISMLPNGKIQLVDRWEWKTREGQGVCIFEES
jgi:hypothetical protein